MQRPNILILYTDQQRWDAIGAAGNPEIQTPNLDRLAGSGTRFSHHFVQNPVCMPSRASFLSGQYPETLGLSRMGVPLPEDSWLLPRYLGAYGYRRANIGKLHALPHANRDHRLPHPHFGFDHLEISDEPGPYEDAYRAWVRAIAPEYLDAISLGLPPSATVWQRTMGMTDGILHPRERFPKRAVPFPGPDDLTHTAFVSERTRAFIAQQGEQPWLCIAGFYSPHSPWIVPRRYLDLYDPATLTLPLDAARKPFGDDLSNRDSLDVARSDDELRSATHGYYAMVSEVDDHVGRILAELDARGLADDTMVIFTSDHGEWLGKYGRYGKGHPADDAVSRVPLLIRHPGIAGAQLPVVDTIVEAVDVLPTILDAAAIPIPPALQGQSLLPLLSVDAAAGLPRTDSALTEHYGWKSLRTRTHRYGIAAIGEEHLFDVEADPHETNDISTDADSGEILAEHRRLLLQRLIHRERPRARTWTY